MLILMSADLFVELKRKGKFGTNAKFGLEAYGSIVEGNNLISNHSLTLVLRFPPWPKKEWSGLD